MSNKNPRPEFMSRLKSLCKNLDKKTGELEQETAVPYTRSVKGPYASNYADSLLEETKKISGQIDQTSQVIKGEVDNLESFLETTMAQFQDHLEEVGRMERYMAQYGYKPLPPLCPEVLNWRTPPAAVDLPPVPSDHEKDDAKNVPEACTPDQKQEVVDEKGDTPSIFDIGLSKQTLEIVAGKSVKSKPLADVKNAVIENDDIGEDVTMNASPILRLTSRLKECNTSLDASTSYTIANNTDTSQVEITPGLVVRRPGSSLRNRQDQAITPNEPSLTSQVRKSQGQATTPNEPNLTSLVKTSQGHATTPNEPNLISQEKLPLGISPSTPTTSAKIEFTPDGTPVMPTLKTVNIEAFNLAKPVIDEKKNETTKHLGESRDKDLSYQTATELESKITGEPPFESKITVEAAFDPESTGLRFVPTTPVHMLKTEVAVDTPEMPDLVTMDIRKFISNAMGLKNNPEEVVDRTTPNEPELTVTRSITDCVESKVNKLGSRATPEEPELKGVLSTSSTVQTAGALEDSHTPELPELSIMLDRTTIQEETRTPDTPLLSNHTLGRFPK